VLEELEALGPPVEAVWGNADELALRELLPKERVVDIEQSRIGLVHVPGARLGREARLVERFPDCNAVVYGHTHLPQADRVGGVWILNPGSPTERRRGPARSLLLLDVRSKEIAPRLVTLT
jgi:putative phosphoesterase